MAEDTGYTPLPADLPEDWTPGQTVAPAGADVGLSEQHGYNYLNKQVNDAQRGVNRLQEEKAGKEEVHSLPAGGTEGQVLTKDGEEDYSAGWRDPVGRSMAGQTVEPTQGTTVTAGNGAEIFNDYQKRRYWDNGVNRGGNVASGAYAHAEGYGTTATGKYSHAEGYRSVASQQYGHAEGLSTTASGDYGSHAEGQSTVASGYSSHAEGNGSLASGSYSHAGGVGTIAAGEIQTAIGMYNIETSIISDRFIVGKGSFSARANCFRVTDTGVYASGNYNSSGADYAELFEWADGNPDKQDLCGLFVTLQGDRIRIATPDDDYILGIVSGSPSVVGDVYDDQWAGMFLTDVFGRPVYEDVDLPAEYGPDGEEILPARTERRQKLNPAYDNTEKYVPRTQRPEWDAVGLVGKLVAVDDGTCVPDGWCTVGEGGVATRSPERTKYRVMARLDESHIRVMIL